MARDLSTNKFAAQNRKARHDFFIEDTLDAGMVLTGTEVKSLRLGRVSINEAFATVAMIAMHDLGLPHDVLNIHGGACALGHPVGASGARILGALINGLQVNGLKRGLASICLGGGEATSMAVELV